MHYSSRGYIRQWELENATTGSKGYSRNDILERSSTEARNLNKSQESV